MLARCQDHRWRMVVWPTSAKGFYEIRSNVPPITLAQRSYTHLYPTDGPRQSDPLPTYIRRWINVRPITLGQRYWTIIGPDFIKTFCRCRVYNHSPMVTDVGPTLTQCVCAGWGITYREGKPHYRSITAIVVSITQGRFKAIVGPI